MSDAPDPRPLSPPDPEPDAPPTRVWHFLSDDHNHEHWVEDPTEVEPLLIEYATRAQPYTLRCYLADAH
jgi:hypothetical protein